MPVRHALLLALLLAASRLPAQQVTIHVAPDGRDGWSGRLARPNGTRTDGPVASPERARDRLRELRSAGRLGGGGRILLHGGLYTLARPLELTVRDSGAPGAPTVIEGLRGQGVTLRGSAPVRGWRRVGPGLYTAQAPRLAGGDFRFRELFLRGRRQTLARFPNAARDAPLTGGMLTVEETASAEKNSFHFRQGQIPWARWRSFEQAEVNLYPYHCWDHNIIRVARVDAEAALVTLRYPVAGTIQVGNRYFVQNVLGALDAPGEWFCDWRTGLITFRPPDGRKPADGEVTVPMLESLVRLAGSADAPVHDVRVANLRLTGSRQDGVTLEGARDCSVVRCTVSGVGGVAVNVGRLRNAMRGVGLPWRREAPGETVHSGDRALLFGPACGGCRVVGCDIDDVGGDAIALRGSENRADNNHISRTGLYDMVSAAVTVCGSESVVSHNTIHDVPRDGVFVNGGRNVVENNDIRRSMMNTADNAAIALRQHNADLAMASLGNVIRYNRITDVIGYGCTPHCTHPGEGYAAPFCGFGIYLDSFISGVTVTGNLVARCGGPNLFIQFGGGNRVENNILVQGPSRRIQYDSMIFFGTYMYGDTGAKYRSTVGPNLFRNNILVDRSPEGVLYKVGHWDAATRSDPAQALFERNLVWRQGLPVRVVMHASEACDSWTQWTAAGREAGSVVADPLFRDAARDDYHLRPGSPALALGIRDVGDELARAGVYPSPERATWPISARPAAPEKHRVFRFPPAAQALVDGFETTPAGNRPRRWQLIADPPAYAQVTSEAAHTGARSLRISDAAGQKQPWQPHLYLYPNAAQGAYRLSAAYRQSAASPCEFYMEMRDWAGALRVGPTFRVDREGAVWANGRMGVGGERVAQVAPGRWFAAAMDVAPAAKGAAQWTLTVKPDGGPAVSRRFPVPDAAFRSVTWVGLSATGDAPGDLWIDDVMLGPSAALDRAAASVPALLRARPGAGPAAAPSARADGLVADWSMDTIGLTIPDASGSGLHADQGGAERAVGAFGAALRTGSGGTALFGDTPQLRFGTGSFTLELWMLPETLAIDAPAPRRRVLEKTAYPASGWVLDVWNDGRIRMEMTDSAMHDGTVTSSASIRAGQWNHVVVSVDRAARRATFTINGKAEPPIALPSAFTGSLDVEGKGMQTGEWQPFEGLIAGVRVYRAALPDARAAARWEAARGKYRSTAFRVLEDD